jgi:hypothetical protein
VETHFGHTAALLVALAVAMLFTWVPFMVQKWYFKDSKARKYLSREWIVIAFLSAIVTYVILRDGALMDKPIVTTIFWCFCINVGVFQAGRLLEKGMSVRFEKNGTKIELENGGHANDAEGADFRRRGTQKAQKAQNGTKEDEFVEIDDDN